MILYKLAVVLAVLCGYYAKGLARLDYFEDPAEIKASLIKDLVTDVDYYDALHAGHRGAYGRQLLNNVTVTNNTAAAYWYYQYLLHLQRNHSQYHPLINPASSVCVDPYTEVYLECGNRCVLSCKYAPNAQSGSGHVSAAASRHDCEKADTACIEGCFCRTGFVRHQGKCIPATECPIRKCHYRDEVYTCGPAAPITCDNYIRRENITLSTRFVPCVWGCFCAQGYLRSNYNGKCILDTECKTESTIGLSPQTPGSFKGKPGFGTNSEGSSTHFSKFPGFSGSFGYPKGGIPSNSPELPLPGTGGGWWNSQTFLEFNNYLNGIGINTGITAGTGLGYGTTITFNNVTNNFVCNGVGNCNGTNNGLDNDQSFSNFNTTTLNNNG